ncbi:MAG TPA: hypothetical protein PL009_08805 [Flavipsychrobacter sp.]|nr:hypothetical protein [Flavipsychrobacter sp.]
MVYAMELHKIILKKTKGEQTILTVGELAGELNVSVDQIANSVEVLKDLCLLEVYPSGKLHLTPTGALAQLD